MKDSLVRFTGQITGSIRQHRFWVQWTTLPAVVFLVLCGWFLGGLNVLADDSQPFVQDHLIVVFKPGVQEHRKEAVHNAHGDQHVQSLDGIDARLIKVSGTRSLGEALEEYQADADVLYVQPNYIYYAVETTPNDAYFNLLWAMKNTGQTVNGTRGTAGADIEATFAWDVTKGDPNVVVGVIDTGVDYTHPDLAANIWSNPGNIGGGSAGTHGFNAITRTYDPMDDNGHGTHVSGTIGAAGNNDLGVVGVNWTTSIMGLKFLDANGSGTTVNAIAAIDFAVQAKRNGVNVRVLNASWGGGGPDELLFTKIAQAGANDILFVAAAGNGDSRGRPINIDTSPFYPASYSLSAPNIIAVAATDSRDLLASWSNYGVNTVQLGAPGVNIASTWPGNQYYYASGTSMATPHVAGSAALVLAAQPTLTVTQLKAAILNNVDAISSLSGKTVTGGRLNVYKAVAAGPPAPPPSAPANLTATVGSGQVSLRWDASADADSYNVKRSTASLGEIPIATTTTTTYTDNNVVGGTTYYYVVSAVNAGGESPNSGEVNATPTAPPDFTVTASPSSRTVRRGSKTTYTVTIGASGGFTGGVTLSASGLPSGASATFSLNPVTGGSGTSTLTVTTTSRTSIGTKTLTITGASGSLSHATKVTLTVTK